MRGEKKKAFDGEARPVGSFAPARGCQTTTRQTTSAELFFISSPPERTLATQQRYTVICVVLPAAAFSLLLTLRAFSVSTFFTLYTERVCSSSYDNAVTAPVVEP